MFWVDFKSGNLQGAQLVTAATPTSTGSCAKLHSVKNDQNTSCYAKPWVGADLKVILSIRKACKPMIFFSAAAQHNCFLATRRRPRRKMIWPFQNFLLSQFWIVSFGAAHFSSYSADKKRHYFWEIWFSIRIFLNIISKFYQIKEENYDFNHSRLDSPSIISCFGGAWPR